MSFLEDESDDLVEKTKISVRQETLLYSLVSACRSGQTVSIQWKLIHLSQFHSNKWSVLY